jgi:DNA polymerase III epsilon subunit-like protein
LDADPALRGLNAHRALGDALVTAAIFLRCLQVFEGPHARPA